MAARFIGKTPLAGLSVLVVNGASVQSAFTQLRQQLIGLGLAEAADLFAEPIVSVAAMPGEGSISWYTELPGDSVALFGMPAERRAALEAQLRQTLNKLAGFLASPVVGPLLTRALVLVDIAGVMAVGERVVLTGWGLAPGVTAAASDPGALLRASPLGRFLRDPIPGAADTTMSAPVSVAVAAPAAAGVAAPAPRSHLLPPAVIVAATGLAAICLLLGVWQGSRVAAAQLARRSADVSLFDADRARAALDQENAQNAALEQEIETRRAGLSGNVCQPNPADVPRLGPDHADVPPAQAVPPPPGARPFRGNLAELLKQAVVVILVPGDHGMVTGSGFFVTPDTIATNRHVVEHAGSAGILVTSSVLGHVVPAQLVAMTEGTRPGSPDLALLRIHDPPAVQPLALTTTVAQLDPVIAAGYPGLTMNTDAAWERLVHGGDMNAVPSLILTDGRINAIQESEGGIKIMPHSANVSGGNSGGPLVDSCGRVVGVNTFVGFDQQQVAHVNYALKADALIDFVHGHDVSVAEVSGACAPAGPAAQSAPPSVAAPAPAAPPAPAPAPAPAAAAH